MINRLIINKNGFFIKVETELNEFWTRISPLLGYARFIRSHNEMHEPTSIFVISGIRFPEEGKPSPYLDLSFTFDCQKQKNTQDSEKQTTYQDIFKELEKTEPTYPQHPYIKPGEVWLCSKK